MQSDVVNIFTNAFISIHPVDIEVVVMDFNFNQKAKETGFENVVYLETDPAGSGSKYQVYAYFLFTNNNSYLRRRAFLSERRTICQMYML